MKGIERLQKNSKKMIFIYGFLGAFMVFALFTTTTTKPTYSASVDCTIFTDMDSCIGNPTVTGCMWSSTSGCTGTGTSSSQTRPSTCLEQSTCRSRAAAECQYGYIGCTDTTTQNGFTCYNVYTCKSAPSYSSTQSVTFDVNGGSGGGTKSCTITVEGGTCNVTAPSATRSGYTFTGWGTAQNCTSGSISAGGTVTVAVDSLHTYYACWRVNSSNPYVPVKKTVVFNANGGSGGGNKECTINTEGSYCTITTPSAPTRSGYTFKGWGTSTTCTSGEAAGINKQIYATSITTYYACWEQNSSTPTGKCYINNTTHKFEWKTSNPGSGYTESNKTQSACTGCAAPYTLDGNNCVTRTASANGCYKCTNTYLYFESGETLGSACSTTADANYVKPTGDGVPTDICVLKSEYQEPKTVTLTFVGTSTKTKSCTIAANANQCTNDLVAPTDIIDSSKNFNGWGETAGCKAGSYTGSAVFRITRASSNKTYYACYDDTDATPSTDYDKKNCSLSMEVPVTRDVRYLNCTYTNISYNNDPLNTTGDSRGNIKKCCLDHGYMWINDNFTSSGFGYEYCIKCGGGTVPSNTPSSSSTISCYGCKVTNGTKYTYATSSAAAANATGGTNCGVANSSFCNSSPTTSCYKCIKNGDEKYTYATSKSGAATATGGTSCETVADTYCNPKTNCFECTVSNGKSYVVAEDEGKAKTATGGTKCTVADNSKCTTKHCYECIKDKDKKYTEATTIDVAKKNTGGTSCYTVDDKYCKTPDNPKTGTGALIVAWMAAIICGVYGLWYAGKTKELNNKKND